MCFSPTASFTAGTVLSVMGYMTIRKVRHKEDIAFAAIPLLFGVQQLTEGVIWISFDAPQVQSAMTFIYVLFSNVLWPTLIPASILLMERHPWRRRALSVFVALGIFISLYFLYYLFTETVQVEIIGKCIAYVSPHITSTFMISPYSFATCVSCLFSSHRFIRYFGFVAFISAVFAQHFYTQNLISVWCFFAAILSGIIYFHFHTLQPPEE